MKWNRLFGVPVVPLREPYRRENALGENALPVGKTCGECVHFKRCESLVGRIADDETCGWDPSRFNEGPQKEGESNG